MIAQEIVAFWRNPRARRVILLTFLVVGLGIQLVRPDRSITPVPAEGTLVALAKPPESVSRLISDACMDCHSQMTTWPWYSNVAPASWLIAWDVRHGREHLDLSLLGEEVVNDRATLLRMAAREVESSRMPPASYAFIHAGARLSDNDRATLARWFRDAADRMDDGEGVPTSASRSADGTTGHSHK